MNISQFPDLTASNSIDVPNISDTMFGDLKEEKKYAKLFYHYTNMYMAFSNKMRSNIGRSKYQILYDIGYA